MKIAECITGSGKSGQGWSRRGSTEKSDDCENGCEKGEGWAQTGSCGVSHTVLLVLANATCVRHHVGDVVLLVDPVQQVGHGTLGKNSNVLSTVSFHGQGNSRLGLVVVLV